MTDFFSGPPRCCYLPPREDEYVGATHEDVRRLGCQEQPRWLLITGFAPDDYTHSCTEHVTDLLGGAPLIDIEDLVFPRVAQA